MLLVIDIGNTNTVLGLYQGPRLLVSWRLVSSHTRTPDEYYIAIKLFCENAGVSIGEIKAIAISSVVPDLTNSFERMIRRYFEFEPLVVSADLDLGLNLLVDNPREVGADRLCDIVAARQRYTPPLIVVDLGTATTFEILDAAGDYIGGAIAPGMITGAGELFHKAAQLYKIELQPPTHVIGKNTREHLQSGIFLGHIAMIEGMVQRFQTELGNYDLPVIATGGFCEEIAHHSRVITAAIPDLTLDGIRLIFERNRRK